jgi:uncharacterized protein (DUF2384 family)
MATVTQSPPASTGGINQTTVYQQVRDEAAKVMDFPDQWMMTPNEQLAYRRPIDVIQITGPDGRDGKKIVLDLIGAIREGVFS